MERGIWLRALAAAAVACGCLFAEEECDSRARALAVEAQRFAESMDAVWRRFVGEPVSVSDEELTRVKEAYERAINLYVEALEIEENGAIVKAQSILGRRSARIWMEQSARARAKAPPPPSASKPPEPPAPDPAPPKEPGPPAPDASIPPPEKTPPDGGTRPRGSAIDALPKIVETRESRRLGEQSLRDFILAHGAARRLESLVTRCSVCNGRGKLVDRRHVYDCQKCLTTGAHLNVRPARRAFWLCHSPGYRADEANRQNFEERLREWRRDPRKLPEFVKSVRIVRYDYHGLWARAEYVEKGLAPATKQPFERVAKAMFFRMGKSWYFFDERYDEAFLTGRDTE
jgi:hypothetical protein